MLDYWIIKKKKNTHLRFDLLDDVNFLDYWIELFKLIWNVAHCSLLCELYCVSIVLISIMCFTINCSSNIEYEKNVCWLSIEVLIDTWLCITIS